MLRLVHNQTTAGAILIPDIDDGLPNKTAHRLGSSGDPKAYARDGYANSDKQKCYVPRTKAGEPSIPGFIDLRETERVLLSASNGAIAKLKAAGYITVVALTASDLSTPSISGATLGAPGTGDVTIAGTGFVSVSPDVSTVLFSGAGVGNVTLTSAQILAGAGGTFTNTSIVVDTLLVPSLATGDKVIVRADGRSSNQFTI